MAGKIERDPALLQEWGAAQRAAASAIGGGWPVSYTEAHSVLHASDPAQQHTGDDHYNATLTGVLDPFAPVLQEWLGLVPMVGAIGFADRCGHRRSTIDGRHVGDYSGRVPDIPAANP